MPVSTPTRGEQLRLVAALLGAPDGESAAVLRELAAGVHWLGDAAEEVSALPLGEWQAEHTRLFVNGHPRTACPPFASAYLDGMTPGPATDAVAALLERAGLAANGMPADYLGTLLECSAWAEEQAAEPAQIVGHELWGRYLQPWLPRFAATLAAESRLILYRGVAHQLASLCEAPRNA